MLDQTSARTIADMHVPDDVVIHEPGIRELQNGWFFPFRDRSEPVAGSQGIIINKSTGRVFNLGSAFPVERDLSLYDRGYQFESYDLVLLEVRDVNATLDTLLQLGLTCVEPTYEHGTVWRIPRRLTRDEFRTRLAHLPCVFGNVPLYFQVEVLEAARTSGYFRCDILECRVPDP
ncbi:MAG: hypothetical protein IPI67_35760 [Myxococcales bacterium]|nr:hypothetical protein [Myxococcales bacterium]